MNKEDALKILKNERLSNEELSEMYWLLNKDQYKERPVTIQEFIKSDDFVHKKWPNIFPIWQETLAELFPNPFIAPYNEVLISAAAGSGKALELNTPIPTTSGIKLMGDINEGDIVYDGYDNICQVIGVYPQGLQPTYRITLENNASIDVSEDHINRVLYQGKEQDIITRDLLLKYKDCKIKEYLKGWLNIKSIDYIGMMECQCIKVNSPHSTFVAGDNIVTHNTVTATISVCYDIYKLGCLKDPCTYYGLTPDTQIIMAIFSATGSTAAVNWNEITTGIEACPWIMEKLVDKRGLERKIPPIIPVEIIPGIFIQTGSKFQHSMGKAIFDGIMDEAAFGGANMKDSQKSYNELSSRIKTRFSTWGTRGNTPGQLFLISSPKEAGDFMQHRIEETRKADSKLTKIMQNIATWDADPRKDSDDKFTVFVGNENKEPCIYEPDEEPPIEEMDDLLYVPMRYYEEFKKDLLISIMNYGGVTTTSDMALFKSVTALNDIFMMSNPFKSDVIELPFAKTDKTLMDFADIDYFRNPRNPEYNRFIHIDAAFSTNTLDVYGLAGSYSVFVDDSAYTGAGNGVTQEDIFSKKDRMYFTDFAVGITAPKGQEVPLYKIQDFIEWLVKIGYPIASVSADQFQSKQTLQNLQVKGFETENISVDKTRDPYLFLRQLVSNKQIVVPKNEYLKGELKHLRDDGKKVDHPVGSHKDIGDAVCGSIWNCASSNKIMNTGRVARQVLGGGVTYSPEQMQSVEMMEYERIKQNLANVFKGL